MHYNARNAWGWQRWPLAALAPLRREGMDGVAERSRLCGPMWTPLQGLPTAAVVMLACLSVWACFHFSAEHDRTGSQLSACLFAVSVLALMDSGMHALRRWSRAQTSKREQVGDPR